MRKLIVGLVVILFIETDFLHATLVDNLDGTVTQIKSDGSQLMWLKEANVIGMSDWNSANSWIDSLNSSNHLGYDDWRMPVNLPVNGTDYDYNFTFDGSTDRGENIISIYSEMAYMHYVELGNLAANYPDGSSQPGSGLLNTGPFINLQPSSYWSQTEYDPINWEKAHFLFAFNSGRQTVDYDNVSVYYTWAVRGAEPIPEPSTLSLLSLGAISLFRKRKP